MLTESAIIGIEVFLGMFALIMIGVPIYLSMLSMSLLGFFLIGGPSFLLTQFMTAPFAISATYNFAVLPLFMIVGVLAADTGIAGSAFHAMRVWFGRFRGGLMMATIGANLVFGACSGASANAIVVFGKVAYPELVKHGYDKKFSMGAIAATCALSSLIPPSTSIVMFSILANISVGTALLSGVGPGLVVAVLYCIMTAVTARVQPHKVPPVSEEDKGYTLKDKLVSLRLLIPIACLFMIIVGGVFFGFFPATVGGAIGAMATVLYAFATKAKLKVIWNSFKDSAVMFSQIFPLIVAGTMFSRVISLSGIAGILADMITQANMAPFLVFLIVVLFYVFCGCVMDILATIIITVPIVFPLLTGLGYNEYVICIVLVFMCEIAGLTPPIGMNVFSTSAILRMDPMNIFKGIVPFFIVDMVMVFLLMLFPQIVTFLPNLLA